MLEPVTGLEAQLIEDSSGRFYTQTLVSLTAALESLDVAPDYEWKTMASALRAAAYIIEAVGNKHHKLG
ncbi:hypothetical protein HZV92_001839 [Salmonella enterica]|nr:hypothetical protein [Salmonella enterica]EFQ6618178.1 hypothetical protein [Salmonella enterica]